MGYLYFHFASVLVSHTEINGYMVYAEEAHTYSTVYKI